MGSYRELTLAQIADAARNSSPELGAIGATLVDYYTGQTVADFTEDTETALFLASAREIVLELVRRLQESQESQESRQP